MEKLKWDDMSKAPSTGSDIALKKKKRKTLGNAWLLQIVIISTSLATGTVPEKQTFEKYLLNWTIMEISRLT